MLGLGSFRFLLALAVIFSHLGHATTYGIIPGRIAVFAFYVVSGYLITRVLHDVYRFKIAPFALNRALRLYPMHYIVAAASLPVVLLMPANAFHPSWEQPSGILYLFDTILIFPLALHGNTPFGPLVRLVPSTWSVAVEIVCYFMLWLFIARRLSFAILTFIAAALYHFYLLSNGNHWTAAYAPVPAALLPFAAGAICYWARRYVGDHDNSFAFGAAVVTWLGNVLVHAALPMETTVTTYANIAVTCAVVLTYPVKVTASSRVDRWLGDLAYPTFLSHWMIGYLVAYASGLHRGLALFAFSLPVILAISAGIAWLAGRSIDPIRDRVRSQARDSTASSLSDSNRTSARAAAVTKA
jgi:peptidoglycan/LPS O-acetylase OafA/YrhL